MGGLLCCPCTTNSLGVVLANAVGAKRGLFTTVVGVVIVRLLWSVHYYYHKMTWQPYMSIMFTSIDNVHTHKCTQCVPACLAPHAHVPHAHPRAHATQGPLPTPVHGAVLWGTHPSSARCAVLCAAPHLHAAQVPMPRCAAPPSSRRALFGGGPWLVRRPWLVERRRWW